MSQEQDNKWFEIVKEEYDLDGLAEYISQFCHLEDKGNRWQGDHGSMHSSEGGICLNVYDNGDGPEWYCHNCEEGGDIIQFVANYHGISNFDAMLKLSEDDNIDLPYYHGNGIDPEKAEQMKKDRAKKRPVEDFIHAAALWYHEQALKNKSVINYFISRGITMDTIKELKLGWAPTGNKLYSGMKDRYSESVMIESGLIRKQENGKLFSFFEGRYVYPYFRNNPKRGDTARICYLIGGISDKTPDWSTGKYVKMAVHSKNNPQILEGAVNHILWGIGEFDSKKPTIVAEGITDAILARQEINEQFNVISPVTAKMNKNDIKRLVSLISAKKPKKEIVICNDNESNKTGSKLALKTAQDIMKLYDKQNPEPDDDTEKKYHYRPTIKIATLRKPPELDKIDIADYIVKDRQSELIYWIEAARTIAEYQEYLDNSPARFFLKNDKGEPLGTFVTKRLRDEVLSEGQFIISVAGTAYIYRDGVYERDNSGSVEKLLQKKLGSRTSTNHVTNAYNDLMTYRKKNPNIIGIAASDNVINVKNGLLDLNPYLDSNGEEQAVLLTHDPYRISLVQYPVVYDPKAECPKINKFLEEVIVIEDDISEAWKSVGYTLTPDMGHQKAFLLYGKGGNGKGTWLALLKNLFGKQNCSNRSLSSLATDNFATADLFGKVVNICGEVKDNYLPSTDIFKSLTGEDTITAQEKFKQAFSFNPFSKLFFSANEMPRTRDKTRAMERRWHFFGFDRDIEKDPDIQIDDKLIQKLSTEEEMSGMLNQAIAGLALLNIEGFKQTDRHQSLMDDWKEQDNPALLFIQECLSDTNAGENYMLRSLVTKCYREYHKMNAASKQQAISAQKAK